MAVGRTISASFLTDLDKHVVGLCDSISKVIAQNITDNDCKQEFIRTHGKIAYSRDAGAGRGGGKLQRDAICTRGRQGKAPFSNRNLRWHNLIVAANSPKFAKKIERIEIQGQGSSQFLVFVVKNENGTELEFPSDKAHEMPERFVALAEHWRPHIDQLKNWTSAMWTPNSCVISSLEASDWFDSVEVYAVLGIAVAVDLYQADFKKLYGDIKHTLQSQKISSEISLPSKNFPTQMDDIVKCPVCKLEISQTLDQFRSSPRGATWQPSWATSKKTEGDDSSIQIMHINPLIETEIRHNASNVRYGHRWCNVSMTDHTLDETLDFMSFVVQAHKKR